MSGPACRSVLALALAACGCRASVPGRADPRLTTRWTGADTAELTARARAEWCDTLHVLEIRAMAGDTGVGLAIYPAGSIGPGTYPIRRPDVADTIAPPAAALGLRWFSKTTVLGFQSDSGGLTLERRPDGTLAGRFTAGARALVGDGRLDVVGSLEGLRPTPAPPGCGGRRPADTVRADTIGDEGPAGTIKD